MAGGLTLTSPWVWSCKDINGQEIRVSITFDTLTHLITGITTTRDRGCLYSRVLIGIGTDGSPTSTQKAMDAPEGQNLISAILLNLLATLGLGTIDNVLTQQITVA